MDKKMFMSVLLIMQKLRRKWEEDVYNTWSYQYTYSVRWMGGRSKPVSLDDASGAT